MDDGQLGTWEVVRGALFRPRRLFKAVRNGRVALNPIWIFAMGFLKRVLGLPGDELAFVDGAASINGWPVPSCSLGSARVSLLDDEPSDYEIRVEFLEGRSYLIALDPRHSDHEQGPYVVPAGQLWMVGDNRNNSSDSRAWHGGKGAGLPISDVFGSARWLWLPAERLGFDIAAVATLPASLASLQSRLDECMTRAPDLAHSTPPAPRRD